MVSHDRMQNIYGLDCGLHEADVAEDLGLPDRAIGLGHVCRLALAERVERGDASATESTLERPHEKWCPANHCCRHLHPLGKPGHEVGRRQELLPAGQLVKGDEFADLSLVGGLDDTSGDLVSGGVMLGEVEDCGHGHLLHTIFRYPNRVDQEVDLSYRRGVTLA